jgi:hypothetical protein
MENVFGAVACDTEINAGAIMELEFPYWQARGCPKLSGQGLKKKTILTLGNFALLV